MQAHSKGPARVPRSLISSSSFAGNFDDKVDSIIVVISTIIGVKI